MRRRILLLGIPLLVLAAVVYSYWNTTRRPHDVEAARVRRGTITASFSADGVVKGKTVEIGPQVAGRVLALLVAEGQPVEAGQVLLRLEDRDLVAGVREAEAAVRAARGMLAQAEAGLALAAQQADAREGHARALLAAARAQLQQALAGPRDQEVAQAQQQVSMARTTLAAADAALRRARELHAQGGLARSDLEEAEARYEIARAQHRAAEQALELVIAGARPEQKAAAQAQVEAALAELEAARSARLEVEARRADVEAGRARLAQAAAAAARARVLLDGATVRAPFGGVVARISVEVGQMASPAYPAVTLLDPGDLWIEADIADEDAAKVRQGQEVVVTVPAYPGRRFRGRIVELAPQAEPRLEIGLRTRVVRAKIRLIGDADALRPGLEVDIEGEGTVAASALVAPSDAVFFREDRNAVFVIEDGTARLRQVRLGYVTYALAEIAAGLKEGDLVVVTGKDGLVEGRRVRVTRIREF